MRPILPLRARRLHFSSLRFGDAEGGDWMETSVVSSERIPLSQVEAELFDEALKKSERASVDEQQP